MTMIALQKRCDQDEPAVLTFHIDPLVLMTGNKTDVTALSITAATTKPEPQPNFKGAERRPYEAAARMNAHRRGCSSRNTANDSNTFRGGAIRRQPVLPDRFVGPRGRPICMSLKQEVMAIRFCSPLPFDRRF
jgi:hypothetical protein